MGNLGFMEIAVILVLALVIFGPQRLPEIARQVGRAIREVRRVSTEFEREVRTNFAIDEHHSSYLTPAKRETPAVSAAEAPQDAGPSGPPPATSEAEPDGPSPRPDDRPAEPTA